MAEPGWIDELKERYLADAGNVFFLHGRVAERSWSYDGLELDAAQVLVRFLKRTREIVAVLRPAPPPARLEFADVSDRARFENLVKAYDLVQGRALALSETDPYQALGRVWRALSTTGTDQAYVVTDTERLLPAHRKRTEEVPGAPGLFDWASSETLRRSNNLILFLAPSPDAVRAELVESAVAIDLGARRSRPAPAAAAEVAQVEVEVDEELGDVETPPPPPVADDAAPMPPPAPLAPTGDLREELSSALSSSLARHPAENRAALLPVMEAVARVVALRRPGFEVPTFALGAEGGPVIGGRDGDTFLGLWRSDIALDAAATMLVKAFTASGSIDETGLSALVRRVDKLLARG